MAIDPIAVTGGAVSKVPTSADVSAPSNAATGDGFQRSQSSASIGSADSIDIVSYTNQQNRMALPLDALSADGKAQYFANPTTLGEEVLNYLEGFHERVVDVKPLSERLGTPTSQQGGEMMSTGPASMMPQSSTSPAALTSAGSSPETGSAPMESSADHFAAVLEIMETAGFRHTETNLVSNVGQQFSRAMSTLMRGQ